MTDDTARLAVNEREAARLLSVSAAALRKWRADGNGPRWSRLGSGQHGAVRYRIEELHRFLTEREQ